MVGHPFLVGSYPLPGAGVPVGPAADVIGIGARSVLQLPEQCAL
jgi:hypothetical protein